MIGKTVSHYKVLKKLGEGGMGKVYLAEDTSLDRKVALKFLPEALQAKPIAHRRFIREAKSVAALDHPFICNIHEVGLTDEGQSFIVMEYVEGLTLKEGLDEGPFPLTRALQVALEVAETLEFAHQRGIIHRDIKPSNIMLTPQGHAKVMDFGLAKTVIPGDRSEQETTSALTRDGAQPGTLAYMSPEQLRGSAVDTRSDLFSLGIVFYQIFTGQHPFLDRTPATTASRILNSQPIPVSQLNPSVPEELGLLISGMLEKDPEFRSPSAASVVSTLRRIRRAIDPSFVSDHNVPIWKKAPNLVRKPRRFFLVLCLLVAFLAISFPRLTHKLLDAFQLSPLPENPTLVVLPFRVTPDEESCNAFAEGLRSDLTRSLAALSLEHGFNVIPDDFARTVENRISPGIETDFGANLGLGCAVEYEKGSIKMEVSLIPAQSDRRLRRAEISGRMDKAGDLAYEVAEEVLFLLGVEAKPAELSGVLGHAREQAAYALFLKGLGYSLSGDSNQEAVRNLQDALDLEGKYAPALAYLGLTYIEQEGSEDRGYEQALSYCQSAAEIDEHLQIAQVCLGEVHLLKGNLKEALTHFERANSLGPFSDKVMERLESINAQLGRPESFLRLAESAAVRQPGFWFPKFWVGYGYYLQDRFEEAVRAQLEVVALAPNNALGFNVLAPYYDRLGCPENSLRAYQKALEIDRGNAGIYTNLATTLFYLGRYREAIEYAKLGLVYLEEDEKSGQPTYIDRGNLAEILYWSSGGDKNQALANFEKALEEVDVYLKDNPGDPYDLSRKAIFQAIIGEKEAAEITIEQALTSETPAAAVLYRAAIIYQHIGRTDRAVRYLEQSLQAGQATSVARNEPIFREAAAFRELLSNYPESGGPCP